MAGLLDFEDPNTVGALQFGMGLLNAGGPSRMPVSLGQGIAQAGTGALDSMRQARNDQVSTLMRNAQMEELKRKQLKDLRQQQVLEAFGASITDPAERQRFMVDPEAYVKQMNEFKNVDPTHDVYRGGVRVSAGTPKPPKMGTEPIFQNGAWQTYQTVDGVPDFTKPLGTPFKKGANASETNIGMPKIEIKTGESVATQIGPILKEARTNVQGAVKMFDIANRIEDAIKTGDVISGPFASMSMKVRQAFNPSGSSKSIQETRKIIRALAEGTVNARKALEGQGAITENEQLVAGKAESGDIDDLTIGELQILADLNRRAAKIRSDDYSSLLETAKGDKATSGLAKFFEVPGMDKVRSYGGDTQSSTAVPAGIDPKVWGAMTPQEKALWNK